MTPMTPAELLVATLKYDPTKTFDSYDSFVDTIPVLIQLGYFEVANIHYGKHWFYVKLKDMDKGQFRYWIRSSDEVSTLLEFKDGTRTVTIPYGHRIFQLITF